MNFIVTSGITNTFLDLPLLEETAGLTELILVNFESITEPFSEDFQGGFAITEDTDFSFASDPFTPLGGTIEHLGNITLATGGDQVTVGEFYIGFEESRVSDTTSGFFVADTLNHPLSKLEILFDISIPGVIDVSKDKLEISEAELLLSPEFATILELPNLAGTNVGNTRIDANIAVIKTVESGVTNVLLDFPLLEEAAGLTLVSVESEGEPLTKDFQGGFAITENTDFSFASDPFTHLGGTIEHSGNITLGTGENQVTVGEFSIGFDESRVSDANSGFFVADTLEDSLNLEVLFDISAPGVIGTSDADLLLSPEFAAALRLPELAGADVGNIRMDAIIDDGDILDTTFIRFQNSSVPGSYIYVTGEEADNIRANFPHFVEEGIAFNAAIEPHDDLIPFFRLHNNQLPGAFLYVAEEELNSINVDPNFSDKYTNQGVAFYAYGVGANQETPFLRFQNFPLPGAYISATSGEIDHVIANYPDFINERVAFEAEIPFL